MSTIHLRNGRAPQPKTWCGKNLFGSPESLANGTEAFTSYGDRIEVTFDPKQGNCPYCHDRFDAAYTAAFPNGPQPIAVMKIEEISQLKGVLGPEAMERYKREGGFDDGSFATDLKAKLAEIRGES